MASAQVELGWTALAEASLAEARSLADAAASAAARGTDPLLAQRALQLQGGVAEAEGDLEESGRRFEEALRLARSVGNRRGEGTFLGNLGWLAAVRQDYEEAAKRFHEHLALTVPSDIENLAILHGNLGLVSLFLGRREASVEHLSLCLRFGRELGMLRSAAEALTGLAAHAATSGDAERALTLWAASDALYASCGSRPTVVEERLRATFLEPLREAGASLPSTAPTTLDGAADYALAGAD